MEKIRQHIIFSGCVQGVGFRYRSMYIAQSLGLTGWVTNMWDGNVEMEIQGAEADIGRMMKQLREQRFIQIDDKEVRQIPLEQESGFHIR